MRNALTRSNGLPTRWRLADRRGGRAGASGFLLLLLLFATACAHHSRQTGDLSFEPVVEQPAYTGGDAPRVLIDESHCNFHTASGRYEPFAELLRRDGFTVAPLGGGFSAETLAGADVLVIANAMPKEKCDAWKLPTPSAFRADEIAALASWVEEGGALYLIADHMPFPGAARDLARAFGLVFIDGYVRPDAGGSSIRFERTSGSLAEHPITSGRSADEQVEGVVSFTGQGFRAVREVEPLLTLPPETIIRLPEEAGVFTDKTPSFSAEGLLQGAALHHGRGRVVVFGEAAMFSAQEFTVDGELHQMGMNAPGAEENVQFTLNVMHWLTGLLE